MWQWWWNLVSPTIKLEEEVVEDKQPEKSRDLSNKPAAPPPAPQRARPYVAPRKSLRKNQDDDSSGLLNATIDIAIDVGSSFLDNDSHGNNDDFSGGGGTFGCGGSSSDW